MIRYFAHGNRDFNSDPDVIATRTSWEFFAIVEGEIAPVFSLGEKFSFYRDSLWLLRPGTSYRWISNSKSVNRIVFHCSKIPNMLRASIGERPFIRQQLTPADKVAITQLAQMLAPHYRNPTEIFSLYSDKAMTDLSILLLRDADYRKMRPLQRRESERTNKAEEWYQAHMKQRPTVDHVASQIQVSTSQLRRDFHTVYGMSPQAVFRRLRLYEAALLLTSTDWTIDRIYAESGFASSVDFHRSFKEEYGMSPHKWRQHISAQGNLPEGKFRQMLRIPSATAKVKPVHGAGAVPSVRA